MNTMKTSRNLTLAYKLNGFIIGAISLTLILVPSARIQWVFLLFGVLILVHCVLGVYAERLQGQTLRMIHQDIKDGRRPPSSHWNTVVVLLMLGAILVTGLLPG